MKGKEGDNMVKLATEFAVFIFQHIIINPDVLTTEKHFPHVCRRLLDFPLKWLSNKNVKWHLTAV